MWGDYIMKYTKGVSLGGSLVVSGCFYVLFSIYSIVKFANEVLFLLMPIVYILSLIIIGIGMMLSSAAYVFYAKKFSNNIGYICAGTALLAGLGYFLSGIALYWIIMGKGDLLLWGIAITFIKVGLFFYAFMTVIFFAERVHGKHGTIGSMLILAFGASYHMFVFSTEFITTLPGAVVSTIAGIGLVLQGISLIRMKNKVVFRYPGENIRII